MPDPADHRPEGHGDAELIQSLEPDQLIANASRPFPRMRLGPRLRAGLWGLRIAVSLSAAMAVYVFVLTLVRSR